VPAVVSILSRNCVWILPKSDACAACIDRTCAVIASGRRNANVVCRDLVSVRVSGVEGRGCVNGVDVSLEALGDGRACCFGNHTAGEMLGRAKKGRRGLPRCKSAGSWAMTCRSTSESL
jgi:hypothetical protein